MLALFKLNNNEFKLYDEDEYFLIFDPLKEPFKYGQGFQVRRLTVNIVRNTE